MILIAECGATKTDWCLAGSGMETVSVRTSGMNLATMPEDALKAIVDDAVKAFGDNLVPDRIDEVHFYAAGLVSSSDEALPGLAVNLDRAFRNVFTKAAFEYASDLLASARAVCGHTAGIACILGTGSNSCLFDGEKIARNVRSAGFILGDEGGGARLGRIFMSDFLKGLVPEPVSSEFASAFKVDYLTVVQNVYRGSAPSGYLGAFAPWILERYDSCEYVRGIVDSNFRDFIERCLFQYDIKAYPVGVTGGFGYAHRAILVRVAEEYGIRFSTIIPAPAMGLVEYHTGKK
jgi:Predicted N-acetylglucosamine kinase